MADKLKLLSVEVGINKQNNTRVNNGIFVYHNHKVLINTV